MARLSKTFAQNLPRVADPDTQQALDRIATVLAELPRVELLSGKLLTEVSIGTSETPVAHTLDAVARGYILVGHDIAATFQIYKTQSHDKNYLYLASTTAVVADLWVF